MKNKFIFVILLAGGIGTRTGLSIPKQFYKINGRYVAEYSILRFLFWFNVLKNNSFFIPEKLIFVTPEDYLEETKSKLNQYDLIYATGGETRHDSTKSALKQIQIYVKNKGIDIQNCIVFIHDVARPIFLMDELNHVLELIKEKPYVDCISLASNVTETIVRYNNHTVVPLNRSELLSIKTPQILLGKHVDLLINTPTKKAYTDLITWANDYQLNIAIVSTIQENIKITYPDDFKIVEFLLEKEKFKV